MKTLLVALLMTPFLSLSAYKKPALLARYTAPDGLNAPGALSCFTSEPAITQDSVYLGCQDPEGSVMVRWKGTEYSEAFRAVEDRALSRPLATQTGVSWYEFDQESSTRAILTDGQTSEEIHLTQLGPLTSFVPLRRDQWVFNTKAGEPELRTWKLGQSLPLFNQKVSFIYPPLVGPEGNLVIKIRRNSWDESEPDELWSYDGQDWKKIFEDKDARPESPWLSFRHQFAVSGKEVLLFARDAQGEALVLLREGKITEIAREGKDLKAFDNFSPKMRAGTIVFRGVDHQGLKSVWVYEDGYRRKLITQGDIVHTDRGIARIYYPNEHSIFYGSPGIGPDGRIVLQATLTDADYPSTLLGIGLLSFEKE